MVLILLVALSNTRKIIAEQIINLPRTIFSSKNGLNYTTKRNKNTHPKQTKSKLREIEPEDIRCFLYFLPLIVNGSPGPRPDATLVCVCFCVVYKWCLLLTCCCLGVCSA